MDKLFIASKNEFMFLNYNNIRLICNFYIAFIYIYINKLFIFTIKMNKILNKFSNLTQQIYDYK